MLKTFTLNDTSLTKESLNGFNFHGFDRLTSLDISHNQLERMPNLTGAFKMETLIAHNSGISSIPIGTLTNLAFLENVDLQNNNLTSASDIAGLLELSGSLKTLNLAGNPLSDICDVLWDFAGLQTLNLGGSNIGCLPKVSN